MIDTYLEDGIMVCDRVRPQIINGKIPDGYITSEEFWGSLKKDLIKRLRNNGYLQD